MTAYCTAADVQRIIRTSLSAVDIDLEIPMADAWIDARGLSSLDSNLLKNISRHFVAAAIAKLDPMSGPVGEGNMTYRSPAEWLVLAEKLIQDASDIPFCSYNEPIE